MRLPNFVVIGAAKSGTSSLYYYMQQHPDIGMCQMKEPNFFTFENRPPDFIRPAHDPMKMNTRYVSRWEDYQQLFAHVSNEKAVGDVSPMYMYRAAYTASRIKHRIPEAKIIAILRRPVAQAYSAFCHLLRDRREVHDDFAKLLSQKVQLTREHWPVMFRYLELGKYDEQLAPYFECFAKENILILLHDELATDSLLVMQKVYEFLGVEPHFIPDMTQKNRSNQRPIRVASRYKKIMPKVIRQSISQWMPNVLKKQRMQAFKPPMLTNEAKVILQEAYAPHIARLEVMLGRKLSAWKNI